MRPNVLFLFIHCLIPDDFTGDLCTSITYLLKTISHGIRQSKKQIRMHCAFMGDSFFFNFFLLFCLDSISSCSQYMSFCLLYSLLVRSLFFSSHCLDSSFKTSPGPSILFHFLKTIVIATSLFFSTPCPVKILTVLNF